MSFKVNVQPAGQVFTVEPNQTLLEAALTEGIMLRHSCREGTCGTCKGKVTSGQIDHADSDFNILSAEEREAGMALYCRAKALSDIQIEAPEVTELKGISIQQTAARVGEIHRISDDVTIVRLILPPSVQFNYYPGQYAEVILKDNSRRSYSMATVPSDSNQLEWHIRNTGGKFSRFVYESLKEKALLRLEGPFGTFYLRDTQRPRIFIASGTGFAPIKALLEQLSQENNQRTVHFYWGGRQLKDLYLHQWVVDFAKKHSWLKYTPVLSQVSADDTWSGAKGFVHHQVLADFNNLSDYEVYACGNPLMVNSARTDFVTQRGLLEDNFFADAFV